MTLSAVIQCHSQKMALYKTIESFRTHYPVEDITIISDNSEDYSDISSHFNCNYIFSEINSNPGDFKNINCTKEYLKRIYDHCKNTNSNYVVLLETDVTTLRKVKYFPKHCGGPRYNSFSEKINNYLNQKLNTNKKYGYAMCGGSCFNREIFIKCYENKTIDFETLKFIDENSVKYGDIILTILFILNNYEYEIWNEVSEKNHYLNEFKIIRDSAFDHQDKYWYNKSFCKELIK
jgi:hypothetical protein